MEIKVGDDVFTKNDYEVYAKVTAVNGSDVTVSYGEDEDFITIVDKSVFYKDTYGELQLPNWTLNY